MNERVTSVSHGIGLYVLRYLRCGSPAAAPTILVKAALGTQSFVQIITSPQHASSSSRNGEVNLSLGHCVVIRAERSGSLDVIIRAVGDAAPPEAELTFEALSDTLVDEPQQPGRASESIAAGLLEVLAHASRRGDVTAASGVWIAGPEAPAPIEGLQVTLGSTVKGVELEYQVLLDRSGNRWSDWVPSGTYAGTRGQFRSVLGARVRLTGARAALYQIEAEALFLGAPVIKVQGQTVELTSGAGVDPLVGCKFALTEHVVRQSSQTGTEQNMMPQSTNNRSGRVRVFRAAGLH